MTPWLCAWQPRRFKQAKHTKHITIDRPLDRQHLLLVYNSHTEARQAWPSSQHLAAALL
jgi:hypothetical protein